MELLFEVTFQMYLTISLFSLATAGIRDVLIVGNPSKERDTCKRKCEAMEKKCLSFQKELANLQGKERSKLANLQGKVKLSQAC